MTNHMIAFPCFSVTVFVVSAILSIYSYIVNKSKSKRLRLLRLVRRITEVKSLTWHNKCKVHSLHIALERNPICLLFFIFSLSQIFTSVLHIYVF